MLFEPQWVSDMTNRFAFRAATIAIMASLASAANAQDAASGQSAAADLGQFTIDTPQSGADGAEPVAIVRPLAVAAHSDPLDPRYGNIDPFYGDIDAFWGHISPFYGDISAFWGNISPFYGNIGAFWGDIDAFWDDISPFEAERLTSIGAFWQDASALWSITNETWSLLEANPGDRAAAAQVQAMLAELVTRSEAEWGATVTADTGKSFNDGFAAAIFARHGIDPDEAASLSGKTAAERNLFFLDWHDTLMTFSGLDHVDHWMAAVNWNPSLTQQQGAGADTVIGIIDSSFSMDTDLGNNVVWSGGHTTLLNGHGAGVASLIAGAHDGAGVMGIAPNAVISAYNPFSTDGTASWDDVAAGIIALKSSSNSSLNQAHGKTARASIINLSLGEPGWVLAPGLAEVFANPQIAARRKDTVYVVAAGNDGVAQTTDIDWDFASDPAVIFVGSVNPSGNISSFSNRPGSACLLDNGQCSEANRVFMRSLVAPGEVLLVSDGQGGLRRSSGTSFAAPLVSGAIALLHDRWPWLAQNPQETTEIIFRSARDLGAPGPDEVYGWGLLDVTASQSPLDFGTMSFRIYQNTGRYWRTWRMSGSALLAGGIPSWWESDDVFFTMFEDIGGTFRDFAVPMSVFTRGKRTNATSNGVQYLQDFVSERFSRWITSGGTDTNGDGVAGFSQLRSTDTKLPTGWSLRYDASLPRLTDDGVMQPVHSAATFTDPKGAFSMTLGHGQGAMALAGGEFGRMRDYDRAFGGVNPVLGFASGETFAAASYALDKRTKVTFGFSENRQTWDEIAGLTASDRATVRNQGPHEAHALSFGIEHRANDAVTMDVQFTRLREESALLGVQTASAALLGEGSHTDAITLSTTVDAGNGLTFDLSATGGRTQTANGQALNTSGYVWSTAGQFAVNKQGVLSSRDALRLSVAQPLTVEAGTVELRSSAVVDRLTGEVGDVTHSFDIQTKRRMVAEALYAAPLANGAEIGLFGRYESEGISGENEQLIAGGTFSLRF